MRLSKQSVSRLIGGNGFSIVRIVGAAQKLLTTIALLKVVQCIRPGKHIVGVVIQQFQLRRTFRDVVTGNSASHCQLESHTTETIQHCFGALAIRIGHFIRLIKDQANVPAFDPNVAFDLLPVLGKHIQSDYDKLSILYRVQIGKAANHPIVSHPVILEHQIPVSFAPAEREVYKKAVEEFYSMRSRYFALTGNSRKDSMMALIQQITLLLRISAAPNTVDEYAGAEAPVKIQTVCNMVEEWDNEIVVIGVRHKVVVESYAEEIRRRFPDRKLFVVTGSTTTLAGRRKLKRTLKESGNGILLCTQQCLPSSVNFEFVNKIIIPELHYNNARMSQFYMRFVRFTSTDWKDIYFVTYSGSIESNQMQMVLAKEKLNLFMKGEDVDLDEIYNRFGVDYDLMSLLMSRDQDKDGNFYISWGEQQIS